MTTRAGQPTADGTGTGTARRRTTIAAYDSYSDAERAVDHLSDNGFPVERASIVGRDLRWVEEVTGRVTSGRAALNGALSGALVGLLIGWLFGVFDWFNPVVAAGWLVFDGLWFGALVGALAGLLAHALAGGRRDFSSVARVEADSYEVQVDEELAGEANRLIGELKSPAPAPSAAAPSGT
jgi:hypothetical protein